MLMIVKLSYRRDKVIKKIFCIFAVIAAFAAGVIVARLMEDRYSEPISLVTPEKENNMVMAPEERAILHRQAVEENSSVLRRFSDGSWSDLSKDEKIAALQTVVNLEVLYLGIPFDIPVLEAEMKSERWAEYSNGEKAIHVNGSYLDGNPDSFWAMVMICHEVYHAYQFQQVSLLDSTDESFRSLKLFDEAKKYREELQNFFGADEDYSDWWAYKSQAMESLADRYAADRVSNYFDLVAR